MRITPLDVRQQQFTIRTFRGFDVQEVDAFLEDVAEDYEAVLKENAQLQEQVAALDARVRGLAELEKTLQDTLVTAQRMSEEMKASAQREAQATLEEAARQREAFVHETRAEEERLRAEVQNLSQMRRQIVEDLKSTIEGYRRVLKVDPHDDDEP
jgi:cell division initiation protein